MSKKKEKLQKVRLAKPRDKGLFKKLWKELMEEEYKKGDPVTVLPTDKNLEIFCYLFDQYTSGTVPGFVLFWREDAMTMRGFNGTAFDTEDGDKYQSFGFYVREAFRNQGIGKLLETEADKICKERGMNVVIGTIRQDNEPSLKACQEIGWKIHSYVVVRDLRE
jgi:GNAT superfamily N-acetyltransferase